MRFKRYYGGYSHASLFLGICILLKIIAGSNCCFTGGSHETDSDSSCTDLRNDIQGTLTCDIGHAEGSTCTFECTRPGYSVCPECPSSWLCNQGSWSGGILPSCCDTEPPTLTCPESVITYAARNTVSAVVFWNTPQVLDNSGETIQPTIISGNSSGSSFEEGRHIIKYEARDAKGNVETCPFDVTVRVKRCEALTARSEQYMSCSNNEDNFTYGSSCSFSCIPGCCLVGNSSISCENFGTTLEPDMNWTGEQPTCRLVQCPYLQTPPANGYFDSSCYYVIYGSTCRIGCSSGFVLVGSSPRRCTAPSDGVSCLGVWSEEPECRVIDTDPPVFSGPHRIVVFAEERSLTAEVDYNWEPVKAADTVSGDITATLVSIDYNPLVNEGVRPSSFNEGVHLLVYQAGDEAGNVMSFTMELVVVVLRCETINSLSFLSTLCTHSNVFGSTCSFRCLGGLCVVGASSVICENIGNSTHPIGAWSDEQPTCQYVHCPELPIPFNGNFVNSQCSTYYGDFCEMSCNPGFSLTSGNTVRQCEAIVGSACDAGFWNGQQPRCEDTTPPLFPYPQIIYLLAERQQFFANLNYNWEPVHATDDVSGTVVGHLVRVNSQPIANLKPTTLSEGLHILEYEAEDEAGNTASGIVPVEVTAARCPEIEPGSFDSISCSHQHIYGSTCTFTCSTGKCLTGSNTVTCFCTGNPYEPRGEWDNPLPTCQPAGCTELTPPVNGYLVTRSCSSTNGSTCEVACYPGYHFQDGLSVRSVQCLVDDDVHCNEGYWRGSSTCLDFDPPVFGRPDNWIEVVTAEPGDTHVVVDYSWEPVTAFDSASWEILATLISIDSVPLAEGGKRSQYAEGTYTLVYEAEDENENKATWSMQLRVRVIRCYEPRPIENGDIACPTSDHILGSLCSIQCNSGYCLQSSDVFMTCVESGVSDVGEWDITNPYCQISRCPDLLPPVNGYVVSGSTRCSGTIATRCEMACNLGYQAVGDDVRYCTNQPGGSCNLYLWTGQQIQCKVITCPSLEELFPSFHTNCNKAPGSDVFGTSCQWHCPDGYRSTGTAVSTCLVDGTWDNTDFTCEQAITCPALVVPQSIEFISEICSTQPSVAGVSCRFRCQTPGFVLRDSDGYTAEESFVTCSESGLWSPNANDFQCVDSERPQFTECPDSHTIYAMRNSLSAYVELNVAAIDNSEEDPTISCNMVGGTKPEGVYNLECSATDTAGNEAICNAEITVRVRRCQPPVPVLPPHGYVDTRGTCDSHFGGGCWIMCDANYQLTGSSQALCEYDNELGHTFWLWIEPPTCQNTATHCSPLPDGLPNGVELTCSSSNSVGSYCVFSCSREGYTIRGVSGSLICQADRSWNVDVSLLQPRCEDIQPPNMIVQCPSGPIYGELSQETLRAEVHFVTPQASDNSQQTLRVETTPPGITPPYNFDRDTLVMFAFFDETGYSVSCSFQVIIQNNLPPTTIYCPRSEELQFDSHNDVVWQIPHFNNPVTGEDIVPICNRQPSDHLRPGVYPITCTATNPDNNISSQCEFNITVGDNLACDMLPAVANGDWTCTENTRTLTCAPNHDVKHGEPTVFTCGDNGWEPPVTDIPLCQEYRIPNKLKQSSDASFTSNIDCSGTGLNTFLQSEVKNFVDESSIGEPYHDMCGVQDVTVECQEAERKRNEPNVYLMLAYFSLEINCTTTTDLNNDKNAISSLADKVSREIEDDNFHPHVANMFVEPRFVNGRSVEVGEIVPICGDGLTRAKHELACVSCKASSEGQTSCEP